MIVFIKGNHGLQAISSEAGLQLGGYAAESPWDSLVVVLQPDRGLPLHLSLKSFSLFVPRTWSSSESSSWSGLHDPAYWAKGQGKIGKSCRLALQKNHQQEISFQHLSGTQQIQWPSWANYPMPTNWRWCTADEYLTNFTSNKMALTWINTQNTLQPLVGFCMGCIWTLWKLGNLL